MIRSKEVLTLQRNQENDFVYFLKVCSRMNVENRIDMDVQCEDWFNNVAEHAGKESSEGKTNTTNG